MGNTNIIKIRTLSESEQIQNEYLSSFSWPKDRHEIFKKFTPDQIKQWLFLMNPREALLISSSHHFRNRQRMKERGFSLREILFRDRFEFIREILKEYREAYMPFETRFPFKKK